MGVRKKTRTKLTNAVQGGLLQSDIDNVFAHSFDYYFRDRLHIHGTQ